MPVIGTEPENPARMGR